MEPKFTVNRAKVSDEEIESKKNFDELLKQFKQRSLEKARKDKRWPRLRKLVYTTVIAGVAIVCTVTINNLKNNTSDSTSTHLIKNTGNQVIRDHGKKTFIHPLSKKLAVQSSSYRVSVNKGGTIVYPTSSKITVPKNAFVKKDGADVNGEVEIQYKEMHDAVDFMLSGIPMTYDSAGSQYHFESAGMIDIKGFQDGEPIFIRDGKKLNIDLSSGKEGTHFNLYELDTVAKQWVFKGKDKVVRVVPAGNPKDLNHPAIVKKEKYPTIEKIEKQIQQLAGKKDSVSLITNLKIASLPNSIEPHRPHPSLTSRKRFKLSESINFDDFPELKAYKGVIFELGEENQNIPADLYEIEWAQTKFTDGPKKGENYIYTLIRGKRLEKLIVYPVLEGDNLKTAQLKYEKLFGEYQKALAKKEAEAEKLKQDMAVKIKAYSEEQDRLSKLMESENKRLKNQSIEALASNTGDAMDVKIRRVFDISNFGIHNTDCPRSKPQGVIVDAQFVNGNSVLQPNFVYLVSYGENIVYNYSFNQFEQFSFNPKREYYIVMSLNDKLYLCGKEGFKNAKPNQDKTTFEFEDISLQVADADELRKKLGV
ncbi:MAG TPA: hypothetical protein VNX68_05155 [Nitrosopumilaceae archaeon]|jgi:hypothetical protein|nr:hypothetical protein [Nitrosopumilaceae archaeon]